MSLQVAFGGNALGRANATADTVWYAVIPGRDAAFTRLCGFSVTSAGTANALTAMRPIGRANLAEAAASGQAAVVLDADPSATGNTIAAGDQVVINQADGTYTRHQVTTSGWNGTTKTLTFTANLSANLAIGAKVWNYGVPADTDPKTGLAHPAFPSVANTQRVYSFPISGPSGHLKGDPILLYCPNATAATVLDYADFSYTRE